MIRKWQVLILVGLIIFHTLAGCGGEEEAEPIEITLGAYYYPWYGGTGVHWEKDNLRQKLIPTQEPVLGEYDCREEETIRQHLEWAQSAGISFFAMSWWGRTTPTDLAIKNHIAPYLEKTRSGFKFCIFYETPDLLGTENNQVLINGQTSGKLLADFLYLARTYFNHPNYLKIDNRPVVFLYLSRWLTGEYEKGFNHLREFLVKNTRQQVYLVGDEIFWGPPDIQRIITLDAITVYNMHTPGRVKYDGYPRVTGFLPDLTKAFKEYRTMAHNMDIGFIPNVMPGFNDRGSARKEKHYVLPREIDIGPANQGSFYKAYFKVARDNLDPDLNIIIITSWNQWHEDTQIEPVATSYTPGKVPADLTGGYAYFGYDDLYLKITKEEKEKVTRIGAK